MWLYGFAPHLYLQTHFADLFSVKPLALIDDTHHTVLDINPIAFGDGLREGMNIATASTLSPECELIQFDGAALEDAQHQLAKRAMNLASWVSLDADKGLYLEIGSMEKLLGDANEIAHKLKEQLSYLHLWIAGAPAAKAARLLALSSIERYLNQDNQIPFLAKLAIGELALSEKLELALRKFGFKTLGELFKLQEQDLAYRVDAELAVEVSELMGRKKFYPKPYQPAPVFFKKIELNNEASHQQQLIFPIQAILRSFCQWMRKEGLVSQELILEGFDREHLAYPFTLKLSRGSQAFDEWLELAKHKLEFYQPKAAIIRLRGYCQSAIPFKVESRSLFKGDSQQQQALDQLLNLLTSRLSVHQVRFVEPQVHHLPEFQTYFSDVPPQQDRINDRAITDYKYPVSGLLPVPQVIDPNQYILMQGPMRIESNWWQSNMVLRDYYVAQHKTRGCQHWIYRDRSQSWFLHGFFS